MTGLCRSYEGYSSSCHAKMSSLHSVLPQKLYVSEHLNCSDKALIFLIWKTNKPTPKTNQKLSTFWSLPLAALLWPHYHSITEHADNTSYLCGWKNPNTKHRCLCQCQNCCYFRRVQVKVQKADITHSSFDLNFRQLTERETVPWSTELCILKLKTLLSAASISLQINCRHYICLQQFV